MSFVQRAMVILVIYSVVFMAAGAVTPVKAQSTGDMNCSFMVNYLSPSTVELSNVHALVGDINSPAADGGTVTFTFKWNDGTKDTVQTAYWSPGAFGISVPAVTHEYDVFPKSYQVIMKIQHARGPVCQYIGNVDVFGGVYLTGLGGIASGIVALAITNVKGVRGRPTWWRPLQPGVPYFMTNRITSLLDMPRWRPLDLNHHKFEKWPKFQMVQGVPSDPWATARCPACGATGLVYTAWGVGCKNPNCSSNMQKVK